VPLEEMPYRLNFFNHYYKYSISDSFYIRISAINAELGEGPYSNITQLRNLVQSKLNNPSANSGLINSALKIFFSSPYTFHILISYWFFSIFLLLLCKAFLSNLCYQILSYNRVILAVVGVAR
jgi:hypothetical protein